MDFACTYQRRPLARGLARSVLAVFLLKKMVLKIKYLYLRINSCLFCNSTLQNNLRCKHGLFFIHHRI